MQSLFRYFPTTPGGSEPKSVFFGGNIAGVWWLSHNLPRGRQLQKKQEACPPEPGKLQKIHSQAHYLRVFSRIWNSGKTPLKYYHGKQKQMLYFLFSIHVLFKVQPPFSGHEKPWNTIGFFHVTWPLTTPWWLNGGIRDVGGFLLPFAGTVRELKGSWCFAWPMLTPWRSWREPAWAANRGIV